jgi:nitrogen fixation/metabolism regulation signal transduction histidine kinase
MGTEFTQLVKNGSYTVALIMVALLMFLLLGTVLSLVLLITVTKELVAGMWSKLTTVIVSLFIIMGVKRPI